MLFIIQKFEPQLKHYSRRLHSEDAQSELTLRFIETIHAMNLDSLRSQGDGTIVAYLAQSVRNAYISLLPFKKTVEPPVSWEELTEAQLLGLVAPIREREVLDFSELLDTCPELTKKERKVLTLIYLHGYTSVDIARAARSSGGSGWGRSFPWRWSHSGQCGCPMLWTAPRRSGC